MSPSSSGSWSGARGADIIDLDRYMRGGVRPSRPVPAADTTDCELVVDAGGVKARHKRFSHDSGVSDSSYSRQRRHTKPHRRTSTDGPRARPPAEPTSTRTLDSSNSLRAFRTVCEQALLEQQRQIAHVAQLCERLTERAEKTERSDQPERNDQPERSDQPARSEHKDIRNAEQKDGRSSASDRKDLRSYDERAKSLLSQSERVKSYVERQLEHHIERRAKAARTTSADVTELSSSTSRSTKDLSRKDRHRTQQCKTYKIIMSKLDELNRLFATRAPPPRRRAPSSSSVTVCDKLVATEPVLNIGRVIVPTPKRRSSFSPRAPCSVASRRVTRALSVDVSAAAPRPPRPPRPHQRTRASCVATESVVQNESEHEERSSSGGDPRCGFDLDDPVHLYTQAKKLQTLTATTGRGRVRGRSVGTSRERSAESPRGVPRVSSRGDEYSRSPSLCAACRNYWRSLRHCLLPQLFSQPDHCKC